MTGLDDSGGAAHDRGASPPRHPLDERYYVRGETEAYGPYDGHAIKGMIEQGRIGANTGLALVGATEWTEIKDHFYFASLLAPRFPSPVGNNVGFPGAFNTYPGAAPSQERFAGFWIRLGAYLIDAVFIYAGVMIISVIFGVIAGVGAHGHNNVVAVIAGVLGFFAICAFAILYSVLTVRSRWQATPGKRLVGLYIVTTTGQRVGGWRALGRHFAYVLSAMPFYIGFLMIAWTDEKQALHDMVCETRVVYGKL